MLFGALFVSVLAAAPTAAHAVSPGSGGWYWPVGTENFKGWDGWWEYRPQNPPRWHMAQDMPAPVGHAVYAVGNGTVLESGGDHGYGGVIVVLHRTADGHYFKAVYGHIIPAAAAHKGAAVKAGQVLGHVNGCAHVHFGIHPGKAYPPDNNPYRGHTYTSKNTYGWVDPVKYLRANPRVIPYSAPAVPTIAVIDTTGRGQRDRRGRHLQVGHHVRPHQGPPEEVHGLGPVHDAGRAAQGHQGQQDHEPMVVPLGAH